MHQICSSTLYIFTHFDPQVEYYSVIKKNGMMLSAATCMRLEMTGDMKSERGRQKGMVSYTCGTETHTNEHIDEPGRRTDTEDSLVAAKGLQVEKRTGSLGPAVNCHV